MLRLSRWGARRALAVLVPLVGLGARPVAAGASESRVLQLPTSRLEELRTRVRAELRGDWSRRSLRHLIDLGVGRARTGLIVVEEASLRLAHRERGLGERIRRVMGIAERILDEVTLNEVDRATLRGFLELHLKLSQGHRPRAAIEMLYRHHLWTADHLPYLISQVDDAPGRQLVYRALTELRARMTPEQIQRVIWLLDAPPYSSERLAMLDEFTALDQIKYANLMKRLQVSFCAFEKSGGLYRTLGQEIRLRALERIRDRLARRDASTFWAVRNAAGQPGSELGATFFRRLEAGELTIDISDAAFAAIDPLRLREPVGVNVVTFPCRRRLDSSQN